MKNEIMGNGRVVEFEELGINFVPQPIETNTYKPVNYQYLASKVENSALQILGNKYDGFRSKYVLARNDQHFFGLITMKDVETDMDLAIGYRNSYNKELSVGLACGAQVAICTNLMITGDVFVMRKNTKNVDPDLDLLISDAILSADYSFQQARRIKDFTCETSMSNDDAYQFLGLLVGHNILGYRQLKRAIQEWHNPSYKHGLQSAWTFYNAVTEALKSCPITSKMTKLSDFNKMFVDYFRWNLGESEVFD